MLEIRVLGSVEATSQQRTYALGGRRQRALLALLAVARGRALSIDELAADLWDGLPPRDPRHALQARVSRLRAAAPVDIEWRDGGYRLAPASVVTDAAHFERLCELGARSLDSDDVAQARDELHQALDLWRGRPFAELHDVVTLRAEAVRLEKLRNAALADRIDADLHFGRDSGLIPELHALVEQQPLAERHWGQLMTALYRNGSAQEALDVFARARDTFTDRLGVEPSNELSRLHMAILQERPPATLLRVPLGGTAQDVPVLMSGSASPRPAGPLTSHQPDVLEALLNEHGGVLLTGPAGIGKTHLLRALSTRFTAARKWAPRLTASPLSQQVPLGVFSGILPDKEMSPGALIDYFTRRRATTVVLVDNVDQLDEASLFVVCHLVRTAHVPAILASQDLTCAPDELHALYDSGDVIEAKVNALSPAECDEVVLHMLGSPLTPAARPKIYDLAEGNPLHLRELLEGSQSEGVLQETAFGWELRGDPVSTPRLNQLVGERVEMLDQSEVEAAALVAIAGEYPATAIDTGLRRSLARAGLVQYSAQGWLRLTEPLSADLLRQRCTRALWDDLSHEVVAVLLDDSTPERRAARRRAHTLALDLGVPIDVEATLAVAEHAIGAFDETLALRAAQAIVEQDPTHAPAHRLAGLASSGLKLPEQAIKHFETAREHATSPQQRAQVALAHARHLGLRHHDARGALAVLEAALPTVEQDTEQANHVRRDAARWSVIAGQAGGPFDELPQSTDAAAALGLITMGMSAVITGPLLDADVALARLHRVPTEFVQKVPGGAQMVELISLMALSNTGDMVASRRRLLQTIADAETSAPESLGSWEYMLGFLELLAGDVDRAYALGNAAVTHLQWRDATGLLPAARALTGAAAAVLGQQAVSGEQFAQVPPMADMDPKVVTLRAWTNAWQDHLAGHHARASTTLLEGASWLLAAQHSYFAGILAHAAARIGHDLVQAAHIIAQAQQVAGGGLLGLFQRHATAALAEDELALEQVARECDELGMSSSAIDTWRTLSRQPHAERTPQPHHRTMALWRRAH